MPDYTDLKRRLADGFPTKQGFSGYYPDFSAAYAERAEALDAIAALEADVARLKATSPQPAQRADKS